MTLTRRGTVAKSIVSPENYRKYGRRKNNGDAVADALEAFCGGRKNFDFARMVRVAADNNLADRLQEWGDVRGLPNGVLRMVLGRSLRRMWRAGSDLVIGDQIIPGLPVEAKPPPAPKEPRRSIRELLEELALEGAAEPVSPQQSLSATSEPPAPVRALAAPQRGSKRPSAPEWLAERSELRRGPRRRKVEGRPDQ